MTQAVNKHPQNPLKYWNDPYTQILGPPYWSLALIHFVVTRIQDYLHRHWVQAHHYRLEIQALPPDPVARLVPSYPNNKPNYLLTQ